MASRLTVPSDAWLLGRLALSHSGALDFRPCSRPAAQTMLPRSGSASHRERSLMPGKTRHHRARLLACSPTSVPTSGSGSWRRTGPCRLSPSPTGHEANPNPGSGPGRPSRRDFRAGIERLPPEGLPDLYRVRADRPGATGLGAGHRLRVSDPTSRIMSNWSADFTGGLANKWGGNQRSGHSPTGKG